jgi:hypothetical protein
MNEFDKQQDLGGEQAGVTPPVKRVGAPVSRRRLIKLGTAAVPVVATLASGPAMAWHCQSPSAWGSEQINPNTSLKTNVGHQRYIDETWYIVNWRDNTARGAVGYSNKPWAVLKSKYPTLKDATTTTSGSFDYTKVTVLKLASTVSGLHMAGANSSLTVKDVLTNGSSLQKSTIVAQLNYLLLSPLSQNELEQCLPSGELQKMASGSYSPSGIGQTWDSEKIRQYLYANWIAR